jgi:hypothetical protein
MYEYDVYADARQKLPRVREPLQAMDGEYYLVKTDILGRTMSFSSSKDAMANVVTIPVSRVREIIAANRAGRKVDSIIDKDNMPTVEEPTFRTEEDSITRFDNQNKRRRNSRNRRDKDNRQRQPKAADAVATPQEGEQPLEERREERRRDDRRRQRPSRSNRPENQAVNAQPAEGNDNREPQQESHENREPRENRERRDRRRNFNNRGRGRGEWQKREGEKHEQNKSDNKPTNEQ